MIFKFLTQINYRTKKKLQRIWIYPNLFYLF